MRHSQPTESGEVTAVHVCDGFWEYYVAAFREHGLVDFFSDEAVETMAKMVQEQLYCLRKDHSLRVRLVNDSSVNRQSQLSLIRERIRYVITHMRDELEHALKTDVEVVAR